MIYVTLTATVRSDGNLEIHTAKFDANKYKQFRTQHRKAFEDDPTNPKYRKLICTMSMVDIVTGNFVVRSNRINIEGYATILESYLLLCNWSNRIISQF